MQIKVFNNFLNENDCYFLNNFALSCINTEQFTNGRISQKVNKPNTQMVSRFNKNIVFPNLALEIQKKLQNKFNLPDELINTQFHRQGIIVNVSFKDAQVVKHKDGAIENHSALRCNIITNQPEHGGVLYIEDKPIQLKQGDLYICLVSEHEHHVSKNESETPRIVWQFAFDVKKENWGDYDLS